MTLYCDISLLCKAHDNHDIVLALYCANRHET